VSGSFIGIDGVEIGDSVGGRKVSDGGEIGSLGTIRSGRAATAENVRVASRHWLRETASAFEALDARTWRHRGSDLLYEVLSHDVLSQLGGGVDDDKLASCFVATETGLVFLKMTGDTLQSREVAEAERARESVKEQERLHKRRGKERLTPILASEIYGSAFDRTLRQAAEEIYAVGGVLRVGEGGTLEVLVPSRISFDPLSEAVERRELARSAEVICRAEKLVLHAIVHGNEKTPVPERLPDRRVTCAGGVE
jgi:hypothetical protein